MQALVVFVGILRLAWSAHDLSETYPFKTTLNNAEEGGLYELYWTFDNVAETISFAVRVQTTGWIGFGISPNGQMPNSDVVVGWVTDDGRTMFHDRFAKTRSPPAIDDQQDWALKEGEEENGFTVLEFSRKYVTCDDNDLPIKAETARVIWSFHDTDDPTSEELTFSLIHSKKGSVSLNLLGGLPAAPPDPESLRYYDITVDEITIPSKDTTYWCAAFRLPEVIRTQPRYVTKFGPLVMEGNEAHVHHLLIYLCNTINDTHVGNGGDCDGDVADEVEECRGGILIAAWAVGGEIFVYPENVAFPFGGEEFPEYALMELHYDNPEEREGTRDSSGMRLWYTDTPREHDAAILQVGHAVHPYMMIPPNAKNFTITGVTIDECTTKFFPENGIHVFANLLHTHIVGHGLTLQHLRANPECDGYEELEPIDRNLQYDFNFQQITHLRREVIILPGDVIQLKCFYNTEDLESVTLGGLSTRDEMCLSFLVYYPRVNISLTLSLIRESDYFGYLSDFMAGRQIIAGEVGYEEGLNAIEWDEDARQGLQDTLENGGHLAYCAPDLQSQDDGVRRIINLPKIGCGYIPPEQCPATTTATATILRASVAVLLVSSIVAAIVE